MPLRPCFRFFVSLPTVWWSLELTVTALAVDATTARFAVAVTVKGAVVDPAQGAHAAATHLLVFHPSSPVPLLRHIDVGADGYSAVAFVPHATPSATSLASAPLDLLVRTSGAHGRLHRLRTLGAEAPHAADAPVPASLEDARATGLLSALYGASIVSDAGTAAAAAPASAEADSGVVVNPTTLPAVLDAPAHTIPRISKVYAAFMQQLLVPASSTAVATPAATTPAAATTTGSQPAPAASEAGPSVGASMGWLEAEANPFSFLSDVFAALPSLAVADVPAPTATPAAAARTPSAKASAAKAATTAAAATPSGKPRSKTHA